MLELQYLPPALSRSASVHPASSSPRRLSSSPLLPGASGNLLGKAGRAVPPINCTNLRVKAPWAPRRYLRTACEALTHLPSILLYLDAGQDLTFTPQPSAQPSEQLQGPAVPRRPYPLLPPCCAGLPGLRPQRCHQPTVSAAPVDPRIRTNSRPASRPRPLPRRLRVSSAGFTRRRRGAQAPTRRRGQRRGRPRSLTVALGSVGHAEEQGGVAAELRGKGGQGGGAAAEGRGPGGTGAGGAGARGRGGQGARGGTPGVRGVARAGGLRGAEHQAAAANPGSP